MQVTQEIPTKEQKPKVVVLCRALPKQDPKMIPLIKNMWWNPSNSKVYKAS